MDCLGTLSLVDDQDPKLYSKCFCTSFEFENSFLISSSAGRACLAVFKQEDTFNPSVYRNRDIRPKTSETLSFNEITKIESCSKSDISTILLEKSYDSNSKISSLYQISIETQSETAFNSTLIHKNSFIDQNVSDFSLKPDSDNSDIAIILDSSLILLNRETQEQSNICQDILSNSTDTESLIKWSSHFGYSQVLFTHLKNKLLSFDLKANEVSFQLNLERLGLITSFDYNPNIDYFITIGGESPLIYVYDIRNCNKPFLQFSNHSHYTSVLTYNSEFDQFLLTAGLDGFTCISNIPEQCFETVNSTSKSKSIHKPTEKCSLVQTDTLFLETTACSMVYSACWSKFASFQTMVVDSNGLIGLHEITDEYRLENIVGLANDVEITV
ncbi:MAG: Protein tssc1 [Paramarteilia canceri]